jgi:hypothetical protein
MDDSSGQSPAPRGFRLSGRVAWGIFHGRAVSIAAVFLLIVAGGMRLAVRGGPVKAPEMVTFEDKVIAEVHPARQTVVFGTLSPASRPVRPGGDPKLNLWEAAAMDAIFARKGKMTFSLLPNWATSEPADSGEVAERSDLRADAVDIAPSSNEGPTATGPSPAQAKGTLHTARLPEHDFSSEKHVVRVPNLRKGDRRAADDGTYLIFLAAPRTIEAASRMVAPLARKYAAQLGSHRLTYHRALVADKIVYRVRVARLTEAEAIRLCTKLKTSGASCEVSKR